MLDFLDLQLFAELRGRSAFPWGISVLFGSGMMKNLLWSAGLKKRMTLIELLVVVAIMAVLMSMTLPYLSSVGTETRKAIAKNQLKAISTALEAYQSAQGFYPVDSGRVQGADIPEFLFAGLHNLPTPSLGGGGETPFFDPTAEFIGLLNGRDDS
ncbi:MAG: type II secretion system protein, partial [Planctomycetota bacterium]|nr:type II secretion system protein [Planctomycetota bacterium]